MDLPSGPNRGRPPFPRGFVTTCAGMALVLTALTRLPLFAGLDFPLNDGGLFLAMADTVRETGFALPRFVAYNGLEIPFAYPPAAFYLTAGISTLFGVDLLRVQLYLPLAFNFASVLLFVGVAARMVEDRSTLFFASVAMPLIPRSYEWLIMGGGLTRSPGMFLTLVSLASALAIAESHDPSRRRRLTLACTFAMGLAFATHLEWGITAWVSTAVVLLAAERSRSQFFRVVAMGLGIGLVSSPWWITVLARHGLEPFIAATTTGGWEEVTFFERLQAFDVFTRRNSWIGVLGAIGFGFALHRRRFLPVVWLLSIYATTPRHGSTAAVMPVSILVAIAMTELSDQVSRGLHFAWTSLRRVLPHSPETTSLPLVRALAFVALFALFAEDTSEFREEASLVALLPEERAGMEWIRENSDPDDRFLVVSSAQRWAVDRTAEWFPVLAGRTAVNAPQGLEWIHDGSFESRRLRGDVLRQVVNTSPSSAPILGRKIFDGEHTAVAVFAEPGAPLLATYNASSRYEIVHRQPHLSVYRAVTIQLSTAGAGSR